MSAARREVPATYTVTLTRDELFELQLAAEARHTLLRDRIRTMGEAPAAVFGDDAGKLTAIDEVRDRDKHLSRAFHKVSRARENGAALSEMLIDGGRL